jgi:hypothetical protein
LDAISYVPQHAASRSQIEHSLPTIMKLHAFKKFYCSTAQPFLMLHVWHQGGM